MVYCESCGAANASDAQQCFACHRSLTDAEPAVVPPPKSNTTNEEEHPAISEEQYKILARVGTGGFGAVYKARALQEHNRLVAIKEIRLRNLQPQEIIEATDTFNREVQFLSMLSHPNLPRIYTHFTDADHWYLVMDFIEGQTLESYLRANGGKLALDEVLAIGKQLCEVLNYLHTREPAIIFRDLKPSNVMLSVYRQVYLIDFGTARIFKPGRPRDTIAFGSPGYAAPEQYGKAQTTPRSDLYSLGALLHQMLTGLDPAASSFQFKPVRKYSANVPDELDQLIIRMLEQEASKRPASAAEVKAELERLTAGNWRRLNEPPGTLSSPIYQPADNFGQPPPADWATSKPSLAQVQKQLGIPVTSLPANPASSRRKISRRAATGAVVALGIAGSAGLLSLAKFPHRSDPLPIHSVENGYIGHVYKGHKGSGSSVAWPHMTSKQQFVASASSDRTVQIWDARTGHRKLKFTAHTTPIRAIACSPNGRLMLSADEWACYMWDSFTGQIYLSHTPAGVAPISALAWSADGQFFAIVEDKAYIYQITTLEWGAKATARLITTCQEYKGRINCIAWPSDLDGLIATGDANGTIQLWDFMMGQPQASKNANKYTGKSIQALSWSLHKRRLAAAAGNEVQIQSDSLTLLTTYTKHASPVTALAWSNTSEQIASASLDGTVHVWNPSNGKTQFVYKKHTGPVRTVAWSPIGDTIASGGDDRTVRIWKG